MRWNVAVGASPKGTLDCVSAWLSDFRKDLSRVDAPTLVVTGKRTNEVVKGSRLAVIKGGPHGLNCTHAEELNRALVEFLGTK